MALGGTDRAKKTRLARPRAGHPRRQAPRLLPIGIGALTPLARPPAARLDVGGRDKPGHDDFWP